MLYYTKVLRFLLAEREGFEPSVPVRVQRFSRPSRSTTPASFQWSIIFLRAKGREKNRVEVDFNLLKKLK